VELYTDNPQPFRRIDIGLERRVRRSRASTTAMYTGDARVDSASATALRVAVQREERR
jgi:hypothetical protein